MSFFKLAYQISDRVLWGWGGGFLDVLDDERKYSLFRSHFVVAYGGQLIDYGVMVEVTSR